MTGPNAARTQGEKGSISVLVAVVAAGLVFAAGLAYDGGQLVAAHSEATSIAQAATRAGAQQIDTDQLATGADDLTFQASRAAAAAKSYIAGTGHTGSATVDGNRLRVTVVVDQPMAILPIGTQQVAATATSTPLSEEASP